MTKPFKFKLQKVLEYRTQLEDQAKMALAKAQMEFQAQVELVEGIRAEQARHEQSLADREHMSSGEIYLFRVYKERLRVDLYRAEKIQQELAQVVSKCRKVVINAAKERKLLEKFKTNQAQKYFKEQQAKEQDQFDEMATLRYEPKSF